ncbi:hypothetical protein F3Y22_tig00110929pilonHSYRG00045 [Hibiscus syriacus]|uniref:Reverse transcriptase n=1 Tax=Hibiscus syriacus TaxID=106335 RepID=A0A6A2ZFC3_HIBSY|nr:hypothetical protein F3Y22_tig00110929pilonHSYRG00045 [Hibiscus syriacus]
MGPQPGSGGMTYCPLFEHFNVYRGEGGWTAGRVWVDPQIYEIKAELVGKRPFRVPHGLATEPTRLNCSTEVLNHSNAQRGVSSRLKHRGAQSLLATQRCQLSIEAQRHRGASELQRMVRTRNGGAKSSHRGVEQEVTESDAPRMVRTRNDGSTSSHRGVEQKATEPVVQETGSVDRRKLEEIEAALAALRAHMISGDRMRRVEETQEDLLETVTDLGNEARDAIGVIQLGYGELKAQVSVLQGVVASLIANPVERVGVRAKIPDPQRFDGARDAKELENFLFDIEQYFRAMRTESEEDKNELKTSFLPENVDYNAHKKLRELSHTGTIREYVREFSTLMLDIKDMSERDKLFHFLEGLKPWARLELQRQKVQDLTVAIAAVECLNDYNDHPGKRKTPSVSGANTQQVSGNKLARGEKTSSWGANRRVPGRDPAQNKVPTGPGSSNGGNRPSLRCFLCNGPHRVAECPKRSAFNAMVATTKDGERVNAPMGDTEPETARMGSIRFITALQSQLSNLRKEPERGLMYVYISVNGKTSKALVDTGATDAFISPKEAERCKLIVTKEVGQMKAVNSDASMICGGLDFMMASQMILVPASSCLMFMGEQPCVVPATILPRPGKKILSAIQFKRGVKKGEPSFLVFPISKEDDNLGMVPRNVQEVLRDFEDVMPGELPKELPPRRLVDHEIELIPGVKPPAKCPYRMSHPEFAELRKQLDELLQAGFIRPSKSPFGAPVLFQRKHYGSLRLCVDYRALNKVTVRNKYLIPLIADLFDQLSNAKYFTKLDLRSGYHQVRVAEVDEPKTTCVFHDYLDKFVVIYLDDIMIFSNSIEEHLEHLRLVLTRLRENRLFVKKEKCAFVQTQVQFLGHIIERGCIRMDKENVKAIQEWPTPQNVSELRSFLGLANYYRRFVEGYSRRVKLLTDLLKKGCEWVWSKDCQEAFDDLKKVVISEPVLTLPDLEKPLEVETDASDYAIGGVLLQDKHLVAFESRKLNETEARYTAPEKELLAVIHCLRIWRHYFLGSKFVVKTDNTAVSHFLTQPKLTAKQARWQEFLAEFDFNFEHKAGKKNQVADALSRRADLAALRCVAPISASRVSNEIQNGLLMTKGLRMFVPRAGNLRQKLLKECHDTPWVGHPDKVDRQRTAGLLEPLPVPARPWESISLDFISRLPRVGDLGSILVVVDRFSKYATFIPASKYCSTEETAKLVFKHVVRYWGIPQSIVIDRDGRFIRKFWKGLFQLLGTQLNFSSSYHPQTDGQTERFNELLEEYLRHFIQANQKNWPPLLDLAQLCFNSQKSSSTNKSPFELVTSQQPRLPHTVDETSQGRCPRASNFVGEWKQNMEIAKAYLEKATKRMKKCADRNRRDLHFQVGDLVLVKLMPEQLRFLRQRDRRLVRKYEGPFSIVAKVGNASYKVNPPTWMRVHPVFHRHVDEILAGRIVKVGGKQRREYLVKWGGFDQEENTWEREYDLRAFKQKIEEFQAKQSTRTSTN